ncbi:MAG: nicotinate-nucleotide adenylyltransferase [Dehalococcoidia bacterium]
MASAAALIGILGGTFDPPHVGHLILAEEARVQLGLGTVLWLPAGVPWRKAERSVSPAADRLEMVARAIAGNEAFELCTVEAERTGPSYMVETLEALGGRGEPCVIMGADALLDLPNWKEPERLMELARLAVARRGEGDEALAEVERVLPGVTERVAWVQMPRIEISSTTLRRRIEEGRSIRYLVPNAVSDYIEQRGLYRGGA